MIFITSSCELCTGPKAPDSTADGTQDQGPEDEDSAKYAEQAEDKISSANNQDERMNGIEIIKQK